MLDKLVHRFARFDHQHDPARFLEKRREFLEGMGADDISPFRLVAYEFIHLGHSPVEGRHGEPVVVHIQNQILAHDGQPNNTNISFRFHISIIQNAKCKVSPHDTKLNCLREKILGDGGKRPHRFLQRVGKKGCVGEAFSHGGLRPQVPSSKETSNFKHQNSEYDTESFGRVLLVNSLSKTLGACSPSVLIRVIRVNPW